LCDEFIHTFHSDYFQHLLLVLLCQTNMSAFQVVSFHNILFLELYAQLTCKVTQNFRHAQANIYFFLQKVSFFSHFSSLPLLRSSHFYLSVQTLPRNFIATNATMQLKRAIETIKSPSFSFAFFN